MSQITWRNIDAPDLTNAVKGVAEANLAMQEAFGGMNTALQGFQEDRERNVSKELLAGVLGASDEAGMDSFMQGERAQQLLASGLVTPETLAAASQQRGTLLNNSLARTNLGVLERDVTNQPNMAAGLMALASGGELSDEQRAALSMHSQGGILGASALFNNRQFDQKDNHFQLSHALQQQQVANQAAYQNARLLQQANANNAQGGNPFGSFSSNGKFTLNPAAVGVIHEIATTSSDEASARAAYYDLLTQSNVPTELRPYFDKQFEDSMGVGKKRRDAAGTPEKTNYSFKDLGSISGLGKLSKEMGIELGKNGAQALYHAFNNAGKNLPDVYMSNDDLSRVLRLTSDMEKSGKLNMNPNALQKAILGFGDYGEAASGGILGAPLNMFNQVLGVTTGASNLPKDAFVPGADEYTNRGVKTLIDALIGIPDLSLTDGANPVKLNPDVFYAPSRARY